jgi:hypothetical protein
MRDITALLGRHRLLAGAAAVVLLALAAIPITAYVIVPQFVRSTVNEAGPVFSPAAGPSASPTAGSGPLTPAAPAVLARGQLQRINSVDFGTGSVSIIGNGSQRFLRFENVEIAAAPAQHVYLSDRGDGQPGAFTDLGALKATSGSFNYEIPASVDLSQVRSVVSWCLQFRTTVTYAPLQNANP